VYSELQPILTGMCVAAALMLIEHMAARHLDFRLRYVLGMLAFLLGLATWAWRTANWTAWRAAAAIALSGGIVILAYVVRAIVERALKAAREAGRIEGRVQEANRRAISGIAKHRDD
jgi:hypothetical protein